MFRSVCCLSHLILLYMYLSLPFLFRSGAAIEYESVREFFCDSLREFFCESLCKRIL